MHNFFLSVDWGTSAFRLRLVRVQDHRIMEEIISNEGIGAGLGRWKEVRAQDDITLGCYHLQVLQNHLDILASKTSISLNGLPILISGMASSSIGIKELPYAPLPFPLSGRDAVVQPVDCRFNTNNEMLLISGLSSRNDVMRGEETQMVGLAFSDSAETATCIFPGTHSKHIQVYDGEIVGFKTYMTGEIFNVVSSGSILKEAVAPAADPIAPAGLEAFDQGIDAAVASNVLHALFSVRVNQLFDLFSKENNYHFLSGLLIGTELKDLLLNTPDHIQLCCGTHLYTRYQRVIEKLNLTEKTSFIPPQVMEKSTVEGQIKLFHQYYG